ncbi:MAG: hypothetical protein K0Q94_504 [Paenibacillus sp.]|jgi:hypothetical protein|uniref:hypothetical protein n=1 Tax=Paenibacillus sp. GCM10012303 TaxID=3317340 RepID=UPI0029EA3BC0|nr:hypothetical protein [Paenibacillus sp.]
MMGQGYTFTIEPGSFYSFEDEAALVEQCKAWGLLSEKAAKAKTFYYKGNGLNVPCSIIGLADPITAVIEFDNKQRHCIHPSYLKEMQASTFGRRVTALSDDPTEAEDAEPAAAVPAEVQEAHEAQVAQEVQQVQASTPDEPAAEEPAASVPESKPEPAAKGKGKKEKIQLPEEKVKMTATVMEFTTVPNHFSDTDDEVIIYEAVAITEPEIELGSAWSSHSATLKKLDLAVGDVLTFEGKIVAKKLTKHPVPYKINNPAKLQKVTEE